MSDELTILKLLFALPKGMVWEICHVECIAGARLHVGKRPIPQSDTVERFAQVGVCLHSALGDDLVRCVGIVDNVFYQKDVVPDH